MTNGLSTGWTCPALVLSLAPTGSAFKPADYRAVTCSFPGDGPAPPSMFAGGWAWRVQPTASHWGLRQEKKVLVKPRQTGRQLLALEVGIHPARQGEGWADGGWDSWNTGQKLTSWEKPRVGRKIPEHVVVEKTATDRSSVEPGRTGG